MKFLDKTWKLALSGAVAGLLVALLAIYGNPANMAICVACFIRDSAGALKLHTAAPVQYSGRRSSALSAARSCSPC